MKFQQILIDYFTFNRAEQRGILVLVSLLVTLVIADVVIPSVIPEKPPDYSEFENDISAFEKELWTQDSIENSRLRSKPYLRSGFTPVNNDPAGSGKAKPREIIIIELNSADTFELQRLKGVGSSFANRIVKYRERLGGFRDKSQLLEVFGMDTTRYNGIRANLTVNQDSIHTININNVTFKDLMKHPYFHFGITKSIMLYRKEHKVFRNIEELKNIQGINDSVFGKIKVYVRVD
jgi:competence ComEA-like helix-hairpin-helix protein